MTMMKLSSCFLALLLLTTATRCVARSWVDTIDPSVYAQAVVDPARAAMALEVDPFNSTALPDREGPALFPTSAPFSNAIGTPTVAPSGLGGGPPECAATEVLYVLRMCDSWGDGWGDTSMVITEIVPTMESSELTTTSRYSVVSLSQTTYMEEGMGDTIFEDSLADGYNDYRYLCLQIGMCYNIEVDGDGDWQDEIKWDITDASACTGSAEACYEDSAETAVAKGLAPAECVLSVPDEGGIFQCPFSCKVSTEAPSSSPSAMPSDAPSLVPSSSAFPTNSASPTSTPSSMLNGIPVFPRNPAGASNATSLPSDMPSLAPSDMPSGAPSAVSTLTSTSDSGQASLVFIQSDAPSSVPSITATSDSGSASIGNYEGDIPPEEATTGNDGDSPPAVEATIVSYPYEVGQRVWAPWMGSEEKYVGEVAAVKTDEADGSKTYDVLFDDGEFETDLVPEALYPIDLTETELVSRPPITIGLQVEARYMGEPFWFGGVIVTIQDDGTCDILYDDGDEEFGVPPQYIRWEYFPENAATPDNDLPLESFTDHLNDIETPTHEPSASPSEFPGPKVFSGSLLPSLFSSASLPPSEVPSKGSTTKEPQPMVLSPSKPPSSPSGKFPNLEPTVGLKESFQASPPLQFQFAPLKAASLSPSEVTSFPPKAAPEPTSPVPSISPSLTSTAGESGLEPLTLSDGLYRIITGALSDPTPAPMTSTRRAGT